LNNNIKIIFFCVVIFALLVVLFNCGNNNDQDNDNTPIDNKSEDTNNKKDIPPDAVNTELAKATGHPDFEQMITELPPTQKQYLSNKLYQYSQAPEIDIELGEGFNKGRKDGTYRVIEFYDYNCVHCRVLSSVLQFIMKKAPDDIYIESRLYPLDIECNRLVPEDFGGNGNGSCEMAKSAICAGFQDKYFEFKSLMFNYLAYPFKERIERAIEESGIDREKYNECMVSQKVEEDLNKDVEAGINLNITSTPYLIWNGKKLDSNRLVILAMLLSYNNPDHPVFKELLPEPKIN
jgi:protein-disulfide isomerase